MCEPVFNKLSGSCRIPIHFEPCRTQFEVFYVMEPRLDVPEGTGYVCNRPITPLHQQTNACFSKLCHMWLTLVEEVEHYADRAVVEELTQEWWKVNIPEQMDFAQRLDGRLHSIMALQKRILALTTTLGVIHWISVRHMPLNRFASYPQIARDIFSKMPRAMLR